MLSLSLSLPAAGCHQASNKEVELFRVEGEPVILSFPYLKVQLTSLNIAPLAAGYLFTKGNGTEGGATESDGRVQQHDGQLWFLPAQASDSGVYSCTYRYPEGCAFSETCTDFRFLLQRPSHAQLSQIQAIALLATTSCLTQLK